jgi:hypothetical protein
MSKEKDLLVRAKVLLECVDTAPLQDQADLIIKEIQELLAQPEYEADRRSDPISKLRDLRDIQGREGNYDMDEYMRGLYNGLELSLSIFEDRSPDYKEPIAQPEPLSDKDIGKGFLLTDVWHRYECFIAGVKWAERQHGITGGE